MIREVFGWILIFVSLPLLGSVFRNSEILSWIAPVAYLVLGIILVRTEPKFWNKLTYSIKGLIIGVVIGTISISGTCEVGGHPCLPILWSLILWGIFIIVGFFIGLMIQLIIYNLESKNKKR